LEYQGRPILPDYISILVWYSGC